MNVTQFIFTESGNDMEVDIPFEAGQEMGFKIGDTCDLRHVVPAYIELMFLHAGHS